MNQLRAGIILNYVIIGLNILVGLAYTPYMLRCLGQNEYGLYSLVASVIAYLTILDFGFGNAIVRYTAKFRTEGKTSEQWEMFGMFVVLYSIIGLLALGGGSLLYLNVDRMFDRTMTIEDLSQARTMMIFLIVNLALTFPFGIFASIITAYEDFVFPKVVQIIRILLCTATLIVLLYWGYKAVAMVVVQTIFNVVTLLLNFAYCRYCLHIKVWFHGFNWSFLKEISIYSFWIFLNTIMDRIYWSTGQFVLGAVSGTVAVAIFSVAITLQQMYMMFSGAISNVLLPKITKMVSQNKSADELSSIFISTGRLQAMIMTFVLLGFVVFGERFIIYWAGEDYRDAYFVCILFFIGLFVPLIQSVGLCILQAKNKMQFRSLCYLAISILSLIGQVLFSKTWGVVGCGIAISLALFIGHGIIMNIYFQKVQHLKIIAFWKEIIKISLFPIIFSTLWIVLRINDVLVDSVGDLCALIFVFCIIYLFGVKRFCLNKSENKYIVDIISFVKNKREK